MIAGKKRVRFPDETTALACVVCEVPCREDLTPEEYTQLYFTKDDFQISRGEARMESKECERFGYGRVLNEVFVAKSKDAQEKLNLWALREDAHRGLERWSNKAHGEKRQQEQFHAIMAVLRAQDDMIMTKKVCCPEQLKKVSYKVTRVARHFARMVGKADSYACATELKDNDDVSLQTALSQISKQTDSLSLKSVLKRDIQDDEGSKADTVDMMSVDELKDSCHTSGNNSNGRQRRYRFGFGRKRQDIEKVVSEDKIRVF